MNVRLVQLKNQLKNNDARRVALVDEPHLRLLENCSSVYSLAQEAIASSVKLTALVKQRATKDLLEYESIYQGQSEWQLLPPMDHPDEPSRCLVSGTGLTHLGSARERQEIRENSAEEKEELALFYQLKGLNQLESEELVEKISRDPDAFLQAMATEELGGLESGAGHPLQAALAAGISTALGAIIPVIPFFWLHGTAAVLAAAAISLIAHFLVGASKSLVTLRTWWAAGLEMTVAGAIVGTVTYTAGLLFQIGRL